MIVDLLLDHLTFTPSVRGRAGSSISLEIDTCSCALSMQKQSETLRHTANPDSEGQKYTVGTLHELVAFPQKHCMDIVRLHEYCNIVLALWKWSDTCINIVLIN